VLHPDEHAAVQNLLASGQGWRRRLFRCLAKDGTIVWLRSTAVARADRRGRLVGLVGASHRASALPADTEALAAVAATVRQVIDTGGVRPVFQPIVSLSDGHLVGVEALSRFHVPGDARSPQEWFTDAAHVGLGIDLEVHAVELALRAATALPEYVYVSVNLSPDALLWPGLATVLARSPLPLTRVVVELTEHEAVQDYDELARALQPLRLSGIRLAVDDAGAGYACFRHILALSPEVIKLDRSLISGIDTDPAQRALAAAIVGFAGDVHATVVAEGIERPAELAAALELSVGCGQGNLLGLPSAIPADSLAWDPAGELLPTANAIAIARHS
jgi:EAL domain-containing protein (putative c-di-GMP-specific phosphodiesterase class I)